MGPMRAARRFAAELAETNLLPQTARVQCDLYGSLALTGIGHGTDRAILLGLTGEEAATLDPDTIEDKLARIRSTDSLALLGLAPIPFHEPDDLLFHRETIYPPGAVTQHPNGVRFTAFDADGRELLSATMFSIGGGFIVNDGEDSATMAAAVTPVPYSFASGAELLSMANEAKLTITELMLENETALRMQQTGIARDEAATQVRRDILRIWNVMNGCISRGMRTEGILPGGLNVRRRAPRLAHRLRSQGSVDPLAPLDWITVYAMAVNEENAAGGRVVTAPTNGAAGVIPAVARYYLEFHEDADEEGLIRYFLASAAIGVLYKENASISGAEVGCQGEVGVACSMAAGGLVAALGGANEAVEHAAEIAMEHNLGMTCDPIGGLVQIPCIERNATAAVKAVQAARIAMNETEGHKVSLDQVIRTMYQTGLDMQSRYKETSLAGLALNVIEC
ncbi:MAG: L-serine ammonia-lyase [Acidobacteria bacterium]|nr:L-serine ammonia-lyase [Acidobacteriota bacterium]